MAGVPDVPGLRAPSTPTRPTAASTPSRSPARTAARGWSSPAARSTASGEDALVEPPRGLLADGRDRRGQGDRRLPPGLRRPERRAVAELRRRKRRGGKPFAVMVARPRRRPARWSTLDRRRRSAARPAAGGRSCCCPRRAGAAVADAVAPGNPDLGVMLPYTPLHHLLLGLDRRPAPARRAGDDVGQPRPASRSSPTTRTRSSGWRRSPTPGCGTTARIHVPCDDSVTRVRRRRRAAGPPLPRLRPAAARAAVRRRRRPWPSARDLKNTCALADGPVRLAQPAHRRHGRPRHPRRVRRRPSGTSSSSPAYGRSRWSADRHPGYRSTRVGRARTPPGRPVRAVQHHHAHVASVMAEHGHRRRRAGHRRRLRRHRLRRRRRGLGRRGADRRLQGVPAGRRTSATCRCPAATRACCGPYRMALAHLRAAGVPWDGDLPPVRGLPAGRARRAGAPARAPASAACRPPAWAGCSTRSPRSPACGTRVDYEAEAAIELEGLARSAAPGAGAYAFGLVDGGDPAVADPAPVIRAVGGRRARRRPDGRWSPPGSTPRSSTWSSTWPSAAASETGLDVVALGGGVFQNALLLAAAARGAAASRLHRAAAPPAAAQRRRASRSASCVDRRVRLTSSREETPCAWRSRAGS